MIKSKTFNTLEQNLGSFNFIKIREINNNFISAKLYFSDGLADSALLDEFVVGRLLKIKEKKIDKKTILANLDHVEIRVEKNIDQAILTVFDGESLLAVEGLDEFIIIGARLYSTRGIMEPPTSTVIKGPREGFTEDLLKNISLMKRKLRVPKMRFEFLTIGRYSRTKIAITYLDGIADDKIVETVKDKLSKIDIDGVCDSSYLKTVLRTRGKSIFKQIGDTEKPDILQAKLLEGRIGIIVDGTPEVLTVPFIMLEDFQSEDDYFSVPYKASFNRILRLISLLVGILGPGLFVAFESFHLQFIPVKYLLTMATARKGIPFSPNAEMLLTLFIFELLNEASIRMPRYVGMALSVVGALVLGETAVRAGVISTPTILIMALSGMSVYTIPDQKNTLSILRLGFLLLCGSLGLNGAIFGILIIFCYLCELSNFGSPYMAPYAPYLKNDKKDGLLKNPDVITNDRPKALNNKNKKRINNDQENEDNA